MASKIDSSSIIAGSTQELTRSTKGRGITSPVQVHSRTALEGEDLNFRYCIPCSKEGAKKIYYTIAPTNFKNHLKSVHSILVETTVSKIQAKTLEQLQALYARAKLSSLIDEIDKHIFMRQLD